MKPMNIEVIDEFHQKQFCHTQHCKCIAQNRHEILVITKTSNFEINEWQNKPWVTTNYETIIGI